MEVLVASSFLLAPVVCLTCFVLLTPQRAVLVTLIGLYLFMPHIKVTLFNVVEYDKDKAINLYVFLSAFVFHSRSILGFRPTWCDIPAMFYCLAQSASSLANDLGAYDSFSAFKSSTYTFFFPYVLGRVFFQTSSDLRDIAYAIFLGGVAYIVPCFYEIRMSPQLHAMLYGVHQHSFGQSVRGDGYRPTVFLQHGLMVGMWMTSASLSGIWLWATGTFKKYPLGHFSHGLTVILLVVTTILCKSTGAIFLLFLGLLILYAGYYLNSRIVPLAILLLIPGYVLLRSLNLWSGTELVDISNQISEERGASLQFRLNMENILVEKAIQQPLFGWGGWGRSRVYNNETGQDISTTDGAWVIIFGSFGVVGLACWLSFSILPELRFLLTWPVSSWFDPSVAPAAIVSVILTVFLIDCLPNHMPMPVYLLCSGALSSYSLLAKGNEVAVDHQLATRSHGRLRKKRKIWPIQAMADTNHVH